MKRPALKELQDDFQAYVLSGRGPFVSRVRGDARADAATRAEIYYEAYRLRLAEALETDFDALRAFLGEERFDDVCRDYVGSHTSDHYSIRFYGRDLARFLRESAPWNTEPCLAELAAFEWAMVTAFDAADSSIASISDMATVPPEAWPNVRFDLHPSLQRIDLQWNAPAIWNAHEQKVELPVATAAEYPVGWMIWRHDLRVYFRSLSVDQAFLLDAMRRGETFAALCEGLTEWIDAEHVAAHAAGMLRQWFEDGIIREVHVPNF